MSSRSVRRWELGLKARRRLNVATIPESSARFPKDSAVFSEGSSSSPRGSADFPKGSAGFHKSSVGVTKGSSLRAYRASPVSSGDYLEGRCGCFLILAVVLSWGSSDAPGPCAISP